MVSRALSAGFVHDGGVGDSGGERERQRTRRGWVRLVRWSDRLITWGVGGDDGAIDLQTIETESEMFQINKLVRIQQVWAKRRPVKVEGGESATKYSGVVLVVTVFIRYEGREKRKWPA